MSRESFKGKTIEVNRENVVIASLFKEENTQSISMKVDGPKEFHTGFSRGGESFVFVRATFVLDHTTKMDPQDFGGIAALTNGFEFLIKDQNNRKVLDLLGGPVKTNRDLLERTGPRFMNNITSFPEVGNASLSFCVGIDVIGCGILLKNTDKIVAVVNDDLTGMLGFSGCIHGYYTKEG